MDGRGTTPPTTAAATAQTSRRPLRGYSGLQPRRARRGAAGHARRRRWRSRRPGVRLCPARVGTAGVSAREDSGGEEIQRQLAAAESRQGAAVARCGRREWRTHVRRATIRWPLGVRFRVAAATRAVAAAAKADVGTSRRRRATRRVAAPWHSTHVPTGGSHEQREREAGWIGAAGAPALADRARARTTHAPTPTLGTMSPSTTPTRGGRRRQPATQSGAGAYASGFGAPPSSAGRPPSSRAGGRRARQTRERLPPRAPNDGTWPAPPPVPPSKNRARRGNQGGGGGRGSAGRGTSDGGHCGVPDGAQSRGRCRRDECWQHTLCLGCRRRVAASRSCSRC